MNDRYKMGSFISRSRSHIVYDVKQHVKELYKLQGSPEQISRQVAYLLERDRFVFAEDKYQVWLTKARWVPSLTNLNPDIWLQVLREANTPSNISSVL